MSDVNVSLGLDQSSLESGLNKAKASVSSFAASLNGLKGSIVGAFSTGLMINFAKEAVSLGGKLNDLSGQTGISAERLQKLDFAAKQNGASIDDVSSALKKLSVNMFAGLNGNKQLLESFKSMGISVEDLKSKSADEIFLQIADAVKGSSDPTKTMSDVVTLLGRSADSLIPLLANGASGIQAFGEQAAAAGLIIENGVIAKLDALGDKMEVFNARSKSMWASLATFYMDGFEGAKVELAQLQNSFAHLVLPPELAALADIDLAKTMVDIGSRSLGMPNPMTAEAQAQARKFNRVVKDPQADAAIDRLRTEVSEKEVELTRSQLPLEQQLNQIFKQRADIEAQMAGAETLESELRLKKDLLELEKLILQTQEKRNDNLRKLDAERVNAINQRADDDNALKEIQKSMGINVSANITDSLARIGGFVGGPNDASVRTLETIDGKFDRLLKILETNQMRGTASGFDSDWSSNVIGA